MRRRLGCAAAGVLVCLSAGGVLGGSAADAGQGSSPFEAASLDPGLRLALAALDPGETTTVVVTMSRQADLNAITATGRKVRLRTLVTELQATADEGQAAILRSLDSLTAEGAVTSYVPLWVVDAVSVTATASVVAKLAARSDVVAVAADPIDLEPAVASDNQVVIGAPSVWELGDTGDGVVVATLDSGADVTHPDLQSGGGAAQQLVRPLRPTHRRSRRPHRAWHGHPWCHGRWRRRRHRHRYRTGRALDRCAHLRRPRSGHDDRCAPGVPVAPRPGREPDDCGRSPGGQRVVVDRLRARL